MANEKLGIVVADFNADITHLMAKVANEHAELLGAKVVKQLRVPGVFDMPLAIKRLLKEKNIQGVVTLGVVIQGDTDHDIVVATVAAQKMTELSLAFDKPVALGVIGPRATRAAAIERADEYAKRAVESCVKMIRRLE